MINPNLMIVGRPYRLTEEAVKSLEGIIMRVAEKAVIGEDTQLTVTDQITGQREKINFKWDETLVISD